ncbi:hypothetical protein AO1008_11692 [Aspergillus oryzae 100-8]|uniref:Uncharacterized protein n=1 Tax=Aspergillus oryzae (strain 3.042) TaxID=1160506 RepID=I8TRK4_ASPO3|nr:hypothetical protein Ao3042_06941 [Aspergillus oryzae 3.042]KDE75408.1 hypothetical protein AO1008_11692 [Aspergillus oryzae 100-8]|eukprot:EIT76915.1 hypothetical protein Ao3042_06941 [Aspergillus oryzae 3.042]
MNEIKTLFPSPRTIYHRITKKYSTCDIPYLPTVKESSQTSQNPSTKMTTAAPKVNSSLGETGQDAWNPESQRFTLTGFSHLKESEIKRIIDQKSYLGYEPKLAGRTSGGDVIIRLDPIKRNDPSILWKETEY